jgi:hypothetical protein
VCRSVDVTEELELVGDGDGNNRGLVVDGRPGIARRIIFDFFFGALGVWIFIQLTNRLGTIHIEHPLFRVTEPHHVPRTLDAIKCNRIYGIASPNYCLNFFCRLISHTFQNENIRIRKK